MTKSTGTNLESLLEDKQKKNEFVASDETIQEKSTQLANQKSVDTQKKTGASASHEDKLSITQAEGLLKTTVSKPDENGRLIPHEIHGWSIDPKKPLYLARHYEHTRWQHSALATVLMKSSSEANEILQAGLQSTEEEIAVTAAIGLTRLGIYDSKDLLSQAAQNFELNIMLRCAALEAYSRCCRNEEDGKSIEKLFETMLAEDDGLLKSELYTALSLFVSAREDDRFIQGLADKRSQIRATILDLMYADFQHPMHKSVEKLYQDTNPSVVNSIIRSAASLDQLLELLKNPSYQVKEDALFGLARQRSDEALQAIRKISLSDSVLVQVAAIKAAAVADQYQYRRDQIKNPQWRVRVALAESIDPQSLPDLGDLAPQLLTDNTLQVRDAMVGSMQSWDSQDAFQVFVQALQLENATPTLKNLMIVEMQRSLDLEISKTKSAEEREQQLQKLSLLAQKRWELDLSLADKSAASAPEVLLSEGDIAQIFSLIEKHEQSAEGSLNSAYQNQLIQLDQTLLQFLSEYADQLQPVRMPKLYADILPEIDDSFARLPDLKSDELTIRRSAIRYYQKQNKTRPLHPLLIGKIAEQFQRNTPGDQWLLLMDILENDESEAAYHKVELALSHGRSMVRRKACVHCANHVDSRHAGKLITLLHDQDRFVRQEAARTLGKYNLPQVLEPLKQHIASDDIQMSLAAATSLAQLNHPAGHAALQRLAVNQPTRTRLIAIEAMVEIADPQYLVAMIRLLDDQAGVRNLALKGLARIEGKDISEAEDGSYVSSDRRVDIWRKWYYQRVEETVSAYR